MAIAQGVGVMVSSQEGSAETGVSGLTVTWFAWGESWRVEVSFE